MISDLKCDLLRYFGIQAEGKRKYSIKARCRLVFLTWMHPGTRAVLLIRLQLAATRLGHNWLATMIRRRNFSVNGIDVVNGAKIGPGLVLRHPQGVVVGARAVIGRNATLMQAVTLGQKSFENGVGGCPRLGDNVAIGAGSVLLGDISIGDGAQIGAHSLVTFDVPSMARVVAASAALRSEAGVDAAARSRVDRT